MKGVIFNLLERTTSERHGELFWERVLEEAGASGAYTSLGNYETEELVRIVTAIAAGTGTDADSVVRQFGRDAIPIFSRLYPQFFSPHTELIPFLLTLNEIIHPEVRKLYPDAEVPHFSYESSDEDLLIMGYASGRGLCALGEDRTDSVEVVELDDDRGPGHGGGNTGTARDRKCRDTRTGLSQQSVAMTVIGAGELQDQVPTGRCARNAERAHDCLCPG